MYLLRRRHDVVVVGARAAGAATALLLARQGYDVAVVDRQQLPSDTLSTHQIARPGVVQLRRWGLLDAVPSSGAPPIRQITFSGAGESVIRAVKHRPGAARTGSVFSRFAAGCRAMRRSQSRRAGCSLEPKLG